MLLRPIVYFLIDPIGLFTTLLLLAWLVRLKNKLVFTYLFITAFVLFFLSATPYFPEFLVNSLEQRYLPFGGSNPSSSPPSKLNSTIPVFDSTSLSPHILILGGGHTADPRLPANDQLSEHALKRLIEGIRIHKMIPNSKLVLSGFSREGIEKTHAEVLAETAIMLGVAPKDTLLVTTPWNTLHEAIDYHEIFGNQHPLILVTNAIHMPRAMMHFNRAGLSPIPAPTGYLIKKDALHKWYKFKLGIGPLAKMRQALKEYIGLLWGPIEWKMIETNS